jgi:hypothetical protein
VAGRALDRGPHPEQAEVGVVLQASFRDGLRRPAGADFKIKDGAALVPPSFR